VESWINLDISIIVIIVQYSTVLFAFNTCMIEDSLPTWCPERRSPWSTCHVLEEAAVVLIVPGLHSLHKSDLAPSAPDPWGKSFERFSGTLAQKHHKLSQFLASLKKFDINVERLFATWWRLCTLYCTKCILAFLARASMFFKASGTLVILNLM